MSITLYRKYRPQTFAEVVGQEHITKTLLQQIKSGAIAHAYLFTGPRGVGKTTTARLLAKAVNAHDEKTGEPDNESPINKAISAGKSLDLVEIDAASNRRIEEIRELREHVKYPPNEAKYKVFIIDEVHMLTSEAFNALLKTLEEPPDFVIFILATTEVNKLPETIISRCQRFDFKKVKPDVLQRRLQVIAKSEGVEVEESILKTVVKLSEGCVRDAESLLGQILSLGGKKITEKDASIFLPKSNVIWLDKLWKSISSLDLTGTLKVLKELSESEIDLEYFYDDWLELLRHILIWKINPRSDEPVFVVSESIASGIKKQIPFNVTDIKFIIDVFVRYREFLDTFPRPVMALEMAAVEILSNFNNNDSGSSWALTDSKANKKEDLIKNNKTIDPHSSSKKDNIKSSSINWQAVVAKVAESAPGLAQYLRSTKIKEEKGNLIILIGHSFHYEIIKKPNYLKIIQNALNSVVGFNINLKIRLDESLLLKNDRDSFLENIINIFGGKIIDEAPKDNY